MKKYIYPAVITLITTPFITDCLENRLQQRRTTGAASAINPENPAHRDRLTEVIRQRNEARRKYLKFIAFERSYQGKLSRSRPCCQPDRCEEWLSYRTLRDRMDEVTPRKLQDYFHARETRTQKCAGLVDFCCPIYTIIGSPLVACLQLGEYLRVANNQSVLSENAFVCACAAECCCWLGIGVTMGMITEAACNDNSLNDLPPAPIMVEQPLTPIMAEQPIVYRPEQEVYRPDALTME